MAEVKAQLEKDLVVLGSGELIRTLLEHQLVDEFVLFIHPLVLGAGRKLFTEGLPTNELQLTESLTTSTGVMIARYTTR